MKKSEVIHRQAQFFAGLLLAWLFISSNAVRAEEFGEVSVSAAAIYTGNTYHGYAEIEVTIENHSTTKAHDVTLTLPDNSWSSGNSIGSIVRTVSVEPQARQVISLWQPPLPMNGDGNLRVAVDGHHEGQVRAPNSNSHFNMYSGRGGQASVLVSRNLNFDSVEHLFNSSKGAFTAQMAVGAPDAHGYGIQAQAWVPDLGSRGIDNWLELDYVPAQTAKGLTIYYTQSPVRSGNIELIGAAGTNVASFPMSSGHNSSGGSAGYQMYYSFPETAVPVKTVRLDFGKLPPGTIAVDAVELHGTTNSLWATDARASSDNSARAMSYTSGSGEENIDCIRSESPVTEWTESWLGYSPFDLVVLSTSDMNSMSPAVTSAVGDYLQAGGNILLVGDHDLPAAWHPSAQVQTGDGVEYTIGFGRCFVMHADNAGALDTKPVQRLREVVRNTSGYWRALPSDPNAANTMMPVIENLKIPARGIVIVMVAFIIVIGPANIIILSRRNRRTWMLWTIPVISLVTTLLVFVYSLLREGITPDTRIAGLTLIDQKTHHLSTFGGAAFYCPLTPSGGLSFEYDTEVTPLVLTGYGGGSVREVDWTQAQNLSRGWVSARVPAHFHIRKSGISRERVQVLMQDGKPQIVNGLGAPIKSLWYADANMKLYQVGNVEAGQQIGLIPVLNVQSVAKAGPEALLHDISYVANQDSLQSNMSHYLLPNSYIALLNENPFIENGLGSAASPKRTKSSAVVFGLVDPADSP